MKNTIITLMAAAVLTGCGNAQEKPTNAVPVFDPFKVAGAPALSDKTPHVFNIRATTNIVDVPMRTEIFYDTNGQTIKIIQEVNQVVAISAFYKLHWFEGGIWRSNLTEQLTEAPQVISRTLKTNVQTR